jgi:hypothetical protein
MGEKERDAQEGEAEPEKTERNAKAGKKQKQ